MKKVFFVLLVIIINPLLFAGKQDPIKIGLITNITGETSRDTVTSRYAIEMAVDEINNSGGIKGRKIKLIQYDNESTSFGSKIAAEKAVGDNVTAVLGCHYSSYALAAAPVFQAHGIPLIVDTATLPSVTMTGNYIFRVCFTDDYQGKIIAKLLRHKAKAKTVTAIIDTDSKYSIGLTEITLNEFKKRGGDVINIFHIRSDDNEFPGIIKALKEKKSDAVLITSYTIQTSLIIKSLRLNGIQSVLAGGDSWSPRILTYIGEISGENYFISGWSSHLNTSQTKQFIKCFNSRYTEQAITQSAALGYDSVMLLADAIGRAGTDRKKLRDAIASTNNFNGLTGSIVFDKNRNPRKRAVLNRLCGLNVVSEFY